MKNWREKLIKKIKAILKKDNTGHDLYHGLRTETLALIIGKKENCDLEVLSAAALIHDIGRQKEPKKWHVDVGVNFAKKELVKTGFSKEKVRKVIEAIKLHEEGRKWLKSGKSRPKFKETIILQDADRLDSIGAIGTARLFVFAGCHHVPIYIPGKKISKRYAKGAFVPNELKHMEMHMLPTEFSTKIARNMANRRKKFMKIFIKQFYQEWKGKR